MIKVPVENGNFSFNTLEKNLKNERGINFFFRFSHSDPAPVERYEIKKAKFVTVYNDDSASSYIVGPSTLSTGVMPLPASEFSYQERKYSKQNVNYKELTIELARPRSDLLTFGVFGRDFKMDAISSASKTVTGVLLIALGVIASIIYQ